MKTKTMNLFENRNLTKKVCDLMKITGATADSIIRIAKGMMKTYHYAPEVALDVMKKQLIIHAEELHTTVKDLVAGLEKAQKMTYEEYLPKPKEVSLADTIPKQPAQIINEKV
jgi:hypothetical protein